MATIQAPDSGLCVPCSVRNTPDKGRGVFAETDISAGTTVWRHVPGRYEVLDKAALEAALTRGTEDDARYLLTHIVSMDEFPGYMVNYLDEGALINHGEPANVSRKSQPIDYECPVAHSTDAVTQALQDPHFDLIATRNIATGEELLMDYNIEPDDPAWYEEACQRYGVDWNWL